MQISKNVLKEFDKEDDKRNLEFILVNVFSFLSIAVSLLLYYVQFKTDDLNQLAFKTPRFIVFSQLFLLLVTILFAVRKKSGWVLMVIVSGVFVVSILKNILKSISGLTTVNFYENY